MEVDPHDAYKAYVEDAMNERAEELALRGSGKEVITIHVDTSKHAPDCICAACERKRYEADAMRNI